MQKYVIALYIRLSIEDYKYDSLSIENQSLVLHEYAASMPEALNAEIMEFIDNGYSGTNFERPQVQKLIDWCGPIRSTASLSRIFPASGVTALQPATSSSVCSHCSIPASFPYSAKHTCKCSARMGLKYLFNDP